LEIERRLKYHYFKLFEMKRIMRISLLKLIIPGLILIQMVSCKKEDPITVTVILTLPLLSANRSGWQKT
jgi:ABC-type uncharacterized transport system substrate-binding protein